VMVRSAGAGTRDRRSNDPKSSVNAPEKKAGGGGKFTLGKAGDYSGGATVDYEDPNFDPDERRVDPDDGTAYKYEELAAFYKGKFTKQQVAEYWEYECTVVKRKAKARAAAAAPAGPTLAESAADAAKVKSKPEKAAPKYKVKASPPVCLIVKLHINVDRIDDFVKAAETNMQGSRQEKGCLRFDILRDPEDETKFALFEVYTDSDAVTSHREEEHFKAWGEFMATDPLQGKEVIKMSGYNYRS